MKIWLFALCYNEERILPFFLQHYSPIVDKMIFIDAGSTDATHAILRSNAKSEMQLMIREIDDKWYAEFCSEYYQKMRGYADWIIWVDCDEFIYSEANLRWMLSEDVSPFLTKGFQMVSDKFPASGAPITQQIKRGIEDSVYDKFCIFDSSIKVHWHPGRHDADYPYDRASLANQSHVKLLHYRFLGAEYFQWRNQRNYNHMTKENIEAGRGFQTYPDYTEGKYSLKWFEDRLLAAEEVI